MISKGFNLKSITISLLAITAIGLGFAPVSAYAGGELDGKAFLISKGEKGDVLTFEDGKFHSPLCDKWGFGKGDYTTTVAGDAKTFTAKTSSAKHGNIVWSGTVTGDSLEGSRTWTKKGWFRTKTKTKQFTGALKQ
jgi:hypothetical protein